MQRCAFCVFTGIPNPHQPKTRINFKIKNLTATSQCWPNNANDKTSKINPQNQIFYSMYTYI